MFKRNSTVCFLGDSITSNGRWIYEIYDHFKDANLKFFNCGKSGIGVFHTIERIDEGCFIHCPDYIVIMLGMNDVNRGLYSPNCTLPDVEEQKKATLEAYKINMTNLVHICQNFGAEVILCTPTAYDESDKWEEENCCCNSGLARCSDIIRELAAEKALKLIDFHTPMTKLIGKDIYTNPDRTHPNSHGEHIMAQIFLKEIGKINSVSYEGKYEFGKELGELFDISNILRGIAFVELADEISNALEKGLSVEERKKIILEKYEMHEDKTQYVPRMYKIYIDSIDFKIDYRALYVKKMRNFLNS